MERPCVAAWPRATRCGRVRVRTARAHRRFCAAAQICVVQRPHRVARNSATLCGRRNLCGRRTLCGRRIAATAQAPRSDAPGRVATERRAAARRADARAAALSELADGRAVRVRTQLRAAGPGCARPDGMRGAPQDRAAMALQGHTPGARAIEGGGRCMLACRVNGLLRSGERAAMPRGTELNSRRCGAQSARSGVCGRGAWRMTAHHLQSRSGEPVPWCARRGSMPALPAAPQTLALQGAQRDAYPFEGHTKHRISVGYAVKVGWLCYLLEGIGLLAEKMRSSFSWSLRHSRVPICQRSEQQMDLSINLGRACSLKLRYQLM